MKKSKAVFTQVHNEQIFFPIWLKYYSQFYEPSDIYVIHLLKPKPVEFDAWLATVWLAPQSRFIAVPTEDVQRCDFQAVVDRAQKLQRELLERYECVLFAEIDEFVVHESGLGAYIDEWLKSGRSQVEVCNGYEIVHDFDNEPPLDLSLPLLPQRQWWYHAHLYDKPLLTRIPLDFCWGFHHCRQVPWETTDPNLLLLHLNKVDYEICRTRKLVRLANEEDSELVKEHQPGSPGWHHFLKEYEIKNWFKINVDTGGYYERTLIPEHVRRMPL